MIKFLIFFLIFITNNCFALNLETGSIIIAKKYNYVREKTNNNDAPEIDQWLKNCGLGKGNPYCASYIASIKKETYENEGKKSPWPMIGSVSMFANYCNKRPFDFKLISTKKLQWNIDSVQPGDVISW
jgi:hypothetical protein